MKRTIRKRRMDGIVQRYHVGRKVKRKRPFGTDAEIPLANFPESFGYEGETRNMTPDQFLKTTFEEVQRKQKRGDTTPFYDLQDYLDNVIIPSNVQKLKEELNKKGTKVDIPYLEFDDKGVPVGHEGRHRATAAKEIGMKKIPVRIIRKPIRKRRLFGNKKIDFLDLEDPEFHSKSIMRDESNPSLYGKVKRVSGSDLGKGIAASGVIVPVVLPVPLTTAVGAAVAKNIDNVAFEMTDEHDRPKRIPSFRVTRR